MFDWKSILACGAVLVCLALVFTWRTTPHDLDASRYASSQDYSWNTPTHKRPSSHTHSKPSPEDEGPQEGAPAEQKDTATVANNPEVQRQPAACGAELSTAYYKCRREALLVGCGQLCDTSIAGTPSKWFNFVAKKFDCRALWSNVDIDSSATDAQWPPPDMPPPEMLADFSHGGRITINRAGHMKNRYSGTNALSPVWKKEDIEKYLDQARAGTLIGTYDVGVVKDVQAALAQMDLKGKTVLVIGSENPWVEVLALLAGAGMVYTQEYGHITSTHPQLRTMTPGEMRLMFFNNTLPKFDAILTYSSVEHSGLGRYGDALNPWGDIQAIARAWCVARSGAMMLLGVPSCGAPDRIDFNMHRCYHTQMWAQMTANWEQVWKAEPEPWQGPRVFRRVEQPG